MARQANGQYLQPANTAAVSGQTISSTAFNTLVTDIGTELTNSVDRGGRSAMTAPLPMGGQKITGMADPTVSTDGATKNYVDTTTATFFSTGDLKPTLKSAPDSAWLMLDDGTFGSGSSGSSNSSNIANLALFTLLFNTPFTDANVPIFTSGGGATTRAAQVSASAAWAANCRMSLPKALGRAFGAAGVGAGLTTRTLGQALGEETHILSQTEMPQHSHTGTTGNDSPDHSHNLAGYVVGTGTITASNYVAGPVPFGATSNPQTGGASTRHTHNFTTDVTGSTLAHNNMPPIIFVNWMVKL